MYQTSKYYSYIFYTSRNVRPCAILGYTLTTFPKSRKTLLHNQSNRNLWHNCKIVTKQKTTKTKPSTELRAVAPCSMTHKTLKELKTFLIDLFANPKMREAIPGTASVSGEPGVFSIGQHVENKVVNPTIADVSKIRQDMNALQVGFNKISSADFRNKTSKPWKPEVTPPKRRGGFNRGRGGRQYENAYRNDRFKNENDGQNRDINQRDNTENFKNRGQGRGRFKSNFRGKGRGRGGFDKSPNVRRPRVASKTVDKDKMRCHYSNKFGHFIRECSKKTRDEKKAGQFSGMSMDYYGDDLYTGEDYDDEVFATLNS